MAANPRKFSEKIALMRAKEAEADAAFHSILNEVSGITKPSDTHILPYGNQMLKPVASHGAPYAPYKTGSLPNINQSLQMQQQQQQQQIQGHSIQPGMHPQPNSPGQQLSPHASMAAQMAGSIDLKSAIHDLNSLNGGDMGRRRFMPPQYPSSVRQQRSRTMDHSPYSPYLTPHPLNGPEWKKFKSDSDIHGSMKQQQPSSSSSDSPNSGLVSPMIHRRVLEVGGSSGMMPHDMRGGGGGNIGPPPKGFPDGFPSNGMPLNLPMPMPAAPHAIPLSQSTAGVHNHAGSLPDLSNLGFNNLPPGPCSPPNDGYGRIVSTSMPPPDSPSSMRANGNRFQSPLVGSPTQIKQVQGSASHFQYFHQSPVHMMGGGNVPPPAHTSPSNPMSAGGGMPGHQPKTSLEKQIVNETIRQRISNKMLAQQQAQQYRQSMESVPSPTSPGSSEPLRSPDSDTKSAYVMSPGSHASLQQQFDQVTVDGGPPCVTTMNNVYTNGSMISLSSPNDHRHPLKQHSIPDIILTGADDSHRQYFPKDISHTMHQTESFDSNDMFSNDDQFKTDLTPLDLEGLQMLEDPSSALTDPGTEDQLRLC